MSAIVTSPAPAEPTGAGAELARMLGTLLWIGALAVGALGAVGAFPRWLAGDGGPARVATVAEAERRLGARLVLPAYYPQRLAWPPEEIRIAGGRRGSFRLRLAARDGGSPLVFLAAIRPGEPIAPELVGERTVVGERRLAIGLHPARLASVLVDGLSWQELSWEVDGHAVILRSQADIDELVRIARSLHGEKGGL